MKDPIIRKGDGAYRDRNLVYLDDFYGDSIELFEENRNKETPMISLGLYRQEAFFLDQDTAKTLLPFLTKFVETGRLV
jgi:hypothetical protein